MSLVVLTTLNCQVDGLLKVYSYGKNVYFEFEKEKQLQLATQKIAFARCIKNKEEVLDIFQSSLILPKNTKFANCRGCPSKRIDKTCLRNQIYTTIH